MELEVKDLMVVEMRDMLHGLTLPVVVEEPAQMAMMQQPIKLEMVEQDILVIFLEA